MIKRPLIQIYASTPNGDSVCVKVRDFIPYFFAPLPEGMEDTEENLEMLRKGINAKMKDCPVAVTKIVSVRAMNIRNYRPVSVMDDEKFMRI